MTVRLPNAATRATRFAPGGERRGDAPEAAEFVTERPCSQIDASTDDRRERVNADSRRFSCGQAL